MVGFGWISLHWLSFLNTTKWPVNLSECNDCIVALQAYDDVQMAHIDGMMKTMELVCSAVGIPVVEPTITGPVVKPAPAKM